MSGGYNRFSPCITLSEKTTTCIWFRAREKVWDRKGLLKKTGIYGDVLSLAQLLQLERSWLNFWPTSRHHLSSSSSSSSLAPDELHVHITCTDACAASMSFTDCFLDDLPAWCWPEHLENNRKWRFPRRNPTKKRGQRLEQTDKAKWNRDHLGKLFFFMCYHIDLLPYSCACYRLTQTTSYSVCCARWFTSTTARTVI